MRNSVRRRSTVSPILSVFTTLILAGTGALTACSSGEEGRIRAQDLVARLGTESPPLVVNVRSEREYQEGHVPGAVHVSFLATFGETGELHAPKDKPVVVYCEHGPRAWVASLGLGRHGFSNVLLLEGHMSAWREAGLPVEK